MAWIESHQELGRHPKTKRLARLLGVSVPTAVGHLHFLWWWALDYAEDGCLYRYDSVDIADAAMWEEDPQSFVDALVESGFLEPSEDGLRIHDWWQYAGRLVERRRKDADRKRTQRGRPHDVRRTSDGHPQDVAKTACVTVPNLTEPNPTEPETTSSEILSLRSSISSSGDTGVSGLESVDADVSPQGDASPLTGPPTSNQQVIAELGDEFLEIVGPAVKRRRSVYPIIGRLYLDHGPDRVKMALASLKAQLARGAAIQDPLAYVAGCLQRSRDAPARRYEVADVPGAAYARFER